jgi:hypothetical protein
LLKQREHGRCAKIEPVSHYQIETPYNNTKPNVIARTNYEISTPITRAFWGRQKYQVGLKRGISEAVSSCGAGDAPSRTPPVFTWLTWCHFRLAFSSETTSSTTGFPQLGSAEVLMGLSLSFEF